MLQRQLGSRGQRVLIVGQQLPAGERTKRRRSIIKVEPTLSADEIRRVTEWLPSFGVSVPGKLIDGTRLVLPRAALPAAPGDGAGPAARARPRRCGPPRSGWRSSPRPRHGATRTGSPRSRAPSPTRASTSTSSGRRERPDAELISLSFEERSAAEQDHLHGPGRRAPGAARPTGARATRPRQGRRRAARRPGEGTSTSSAGPKTTTATSSSARRTPLEAELLAREDLTVRTEVEVAIQLITNLRPVLSRLGRRRGPVHRGPDGEDRAAVRRPPVRAVLPGTRAAPSANCG